MDRELQAKERSMVSNPEEIAGFIENTCKECGQKFTKAYYKGESPEMGKGSYCLPCIFGKGPLSQGSKANLDPRLRHNAKERREVRIKYAARKGSSACRY